MAILNSNALITADSVREVLDTDLTDSQIHAFINQAYFRTIPLSGELGDCGGSTGATSALAAIQTMLAAHFIATTRERQVHSESIEGGASVTFEGKTGEGLRSTTYGQAALDLDCSGILAKAGLKRPTISIYGHADIDYDSDTRSATLDAA